MTKQTDLDRAKEWLNTLNHLRVDFTKYQEPKLATLLANYLQHEESAGRIKFTANRERPEFNLNEAINTFVGNRHPENPQRALSHDEDLCKDFWTCCPACFNAFNKFQNDSAAR